LLPWRKQGTVIPSTVPNTCFFPPGFTVRP
jgi:hypothetical protein